MYSPIIGFKSIYRLFWGTHILGNPGLVPRHLFSPSVPQKPSSPHPRRSGQQTNAPCSPQEAQQLSSSGVPLQPQQVTGPRLVDPGWKLKGLIHGFLPQFVGFSLHDDQKKIIYIYINKYMPDSFIQVTAFFATAGLLDMCHLQQL